MLELIRDSLNAAIQAAKKTYPEGLLSPDGLLGPGVEFLGRIPAQPPWPGWCECNLWGTSFCYGTPEADVVLWLLQAVYYEPSGSATADHVRLCGALVIRKNPRHAVKLSREAVEKLLPWFGGVI
ncbi:MAG: hypothetical protein ACPLTR_10160 [Thermacetogeniaceae bacterium]